MRSYREWSWSTKKMPREWRIDSSSRLDYTLAKISDFSSWNTSRNVSWWAIIARRRPLSSNMWLPLWDAGILVVGAFFLRRAFTVFRNPSTDLSGHLLFFCWVLFVASTVVCLCWRTPTPSLLAEVVAEAGGGVVCSCSCEGTSISLLAK